MMQNSSHQITGKKKIHLTNRLKIRLIKAKVNPTKRLYGKYSHHFRRSIYREYMTKITYLYIPI